MRRYRRTYRPPIKLPKVNEQIAAPEVRVLDEAGKNLGVLLREEALRLARERGLDLIEVSDTAKPPVVKIVSFDKYRYEAKKRQKEQLAKQKPIEPKRIQVGVRAARNDLELKVKRANEFLEAGYPVTIVLVLRGREKANRQWANQKLDEFMQQITVKWRTVSDSRFGGRGLTTQIIKQ